MFTTDEIQKLDKITHKYDRKQAALLPVLHCVQEKDGLITPQAEKDVAEYLGIPVVHVHEVVCFYHLLHQKKPGKCHFSVCQTTACALRGAEDIIGYIRQKLNISPGETTPDGKFSLEAVECLGACEIAPMMQCNNEYKGFLDKKTIDALIEGNS
ncbi:MAG: NAD(P)H-dependent oxidoreductase subunit E [Candidatus Omnitrophica bacterium]|nr:NAD(P)H-dependent oxidoreductase subunit E [Candidatus Omnitrophota bacterium]MDE2009581.1 NAD(P)H-dependent oxidoreductase subunit E [Candidatus Omnitrophota bacterium]MDE2214625.1 NAD(P)H-dependent oxidoreductase subunit E [Candidatus Omnitrophota bacterium]MDE2232227.1 NAD(P)H-dependent oxidoreductase subunit E [Candidatus Omnitrophota bacterium]